MLTCDFSIPWMCFKKKPVFSSIDAVNFIHCYCWFQASYFSRWRRFTQHIWKPTHIRAKPCNHLQFVRCSQLQMKDWGGCDLENFMKQRYLIFFIVLFTQFFFFFLLGGGGTVTRGNYSGHFTYCSLVIQSNKSQIIK